MTNEEAVKYTEQCIDRMKDCIDRHQKKGFPVGEMQETLEYYECVLAALKCEKKPTGEPLTLEQLREMYEQPVFIDDKKEPENTGWVIWSDSFNRNWTEGKDGEEYGKTWLAYADLPAHIDREAWGPCSECGPNELIMGDRYCCECGRPLTPEAWAELEKRLRG